MTISIPATTTTGSGTALMLAKAQSDLMIVHQAIVREWPMTLEQAVAQLGEAQEHLLAAALPEHLFTEETATAILNWRGALADRIEQMKTAIGEDQGEQPLSSYVDVTALQEQIAEFWSVFTIIDRELTGLPSNASDPGSRP